MDLHLGLPLSSSSPLHTPMAVMFSKMKKYSSTHIQKMTTESSIHITIAAHQRNYTNNNRHTHLAVTLGHGYWRHVNWYYLVQHLRQYLKKQ